MDETEAKSMMSRIPSFTIGVLILCIASSKVDAFTSLFVYNREAILNGELWRLVTAHFVHFNDIHLLYNVAVFGIIGWIVEHKGYGCFWLVYLLMVCSISAALTVLKPDMAYFGGLSGIACGSVVYCSLLCLREVSPWRNMSIIALIFLSVKICLETYSSGSLLPYWGTQDFVPIPLSHITGSLTAVILFLLKQKYILIRSKILPEINRDLNKGLETDA